MKPLIHTRQLHRHTPLVGRLLYRQYNVLAVKQYAMKECAPVSLRELLQFGRPPLDDASFVRVAQFVQKELPVRMARRVVAFQRLPFIVGTNPYIHQVHQLYYDSFEKLRVLPPMESRADDEAFTGMLLDLTEKHADAIPTLARGFLESKQYLSHSEVKDFLDDMIHARISIRLIAEHYIALHRQNAGYIGLCEINYGSAPEHILDGQTDISFQYVPVHLEYIACELLKNAYRATVEHSERIGRADHPPIQITVSRDANDIGIRVRDQGGGIPGNQLANVFEYSYTTVEPDGPEENTALDNIFTTQTRLAMQAGVGGPMGSLPMTLIYARYFGGNLKLLSLPSYGCDVFLRLKSIDSHLDQTTI
ncbi:branched-chain alpha-ketoacid dehydrogenase [Syncephalis fuscata]|nr:branched-chain alpha-ketoacid dehydrogenase [Syncephalis fuscata]